VPWFLFRGGPKPGNAESFAARPAAAPYKVLALGRTPPVVRILASKSRVARSLAPELHSQTMPLFHFKLVDSRIVTDHGVHYLPDATIAQIEAIKLARSLRASRPELIGMNCSISVTDESGAGVCIIPLRSSRQSRGCVSSLEDAELLDR
jgi:hypothetical protein